MEEITTFKELEEMTPEEVENAVERLKEAWNANCSTEEMTAYAGISTRVYMDIYIRDTLGFHTWMDKQISLANRAIATIKVNAAKKKL